MNKINDILHDLRRIKFLVENYEKIDDANDQIKEVVSLQIEELESESIKAKILNGDHVTIDELDRFKHSDCDWCHYESCFNTYKERMLKVVEEILDQINANFGEVEILVPQIDDSGDDYGILAGIKYGKKQLEINFSIWDSGHICDSIYGLHGNFHLGVQECDTGLLLGTYAPYNYTQEVWVGYLNHKEWEKRLDEIEDYVDSIVAQIEVWIEEKSKELF